MRWLRAALRSLAPFLPQRLRSSNSSCSWALLPRTFTTGSTPAPFSMQRSSDKCSTSIVSACGPSCAIGDLASSSGRSKSEICTYVARLLGLRTKNQTGYKKGMLFQHKEGGLRLLSSSRLGMGCQWSANVHVPRLQCRPYEHIFSRIKPEPVYIDTRLA
jgi:hypothetical protein